ncbi:ACT domain-containing protein [Schleiferilactobacillus shenzhenensis]|nr:ACT domain-containing protein [Schleiferilactobacillus shenzhenensis]
MHAIITVVGQDKVGIVAGVSAKLAALNINILDISQTIMEHSFTMMLLAALPADADFKAIQQALTDFGSSQDLTIRIQRQEIFDAMSSL